MAYSGLLNKSSIESRRRMAEALLGQVAEGGPAYGGWGEGIARALTGIGGGLMMRNANNQESENYAKIQEALQGGATPEDIEAMAMGSGYHELLPLASNRRHAQYRQEDMDWRNSRAESEEAWREKDFNADEAWRAAQIEARGRQTAPSGFRATVDGNLEAIPGGPADPNKPVPVRNLRPTGDQSNAAGFYDRMSASEGTLQKFEQAGMDRMNTYGGKVPIIGNELVSPDYQQFDQARRDFINAQLRKESGAVISAEEFDNANKQYFPQPGDGPDVIAQKRRNRQIAIDSMKRTAGPALAGQPADQAAMPEDGAVEFGEVGEIPEGAVVEDETGALYRKENGTLVPVQ